MASRSFRLRNSTKATAAGTDVKALLMSKGVPLAVTPEPFTVEAARYQMAVEALEPAHHQRRGSWTGAHLLRLRTFFQVGPKLRSPQCG